MVILEANGLNKNYGKKEVLKNINFNIESGKIVGLLGPNGSGKTTLIKIITGLIKDYKGTIRVDDNIPNVYTKSIVSYLPEKTYLSDWMSVKDAIFMFNDFYKDFNIDKANDMVKHFDLDMKQNIKTMSKGMQEKLQLILVMSREAKLYILDEPIGGVDPVSRDYILDVILKNYSEDSTILLSTHLIHDVEKIFDKVLFIKNGEIIVDNYVDTLREENKMSLDEYFREVYK